MKNSLYKENIIDHYKNPRNLGTLDSPDMTFSKNNGSCGDEMSIYIKHDGEFITDVKFTATGCAISIASMSILSEDLVGMSISKLKDIGISEVLLNLGMEETSGRIKCALLPLDALKSED